MNDRRIVERASRRMTEEAAAWYLDMRESPDERTRERFLAWVRRSPQHVAEYMAIAQLHGDMRAVTATLQATTGDLREFAATEANVVPFRLDQPLPRMAAPVPGKRRVAPMRWAAVAASLVIAGAAAFLGRPGTDVAGVRYVALHDVRDVALDDDTRLQLAPGAIVDVRFDAHTRRIELIQGAASFDIGNDPARPMTVTAGSQRIDDIGTVFDVSRRDDETQVTVVSGRVAISEAPSPWLDRAHRRITGSMWPRSPIVELAGGDTARVASDGTLLEHGKADGSETPEWLPADIRFHDSSVADVARRFNAYTATPLFIDDPALARKRISGVFHARDPDAFVSYLGSLPHVKVVRETSRIRFTAVHGEKAL